MKGKRKSNNGTATTKSAGTEEELKGEQRVEEAQRREVATCGYSLSVVKCYYKCGDLYERPRCGPFLGRVTRRRLLSARILGNDFTFTLWLSLATF